MRVGWVIGVASALALGCSANATGTAGSDSNGRSQTTKGDDSQFIGEPGVATGVGGSSSSQPPPTGDPRINVPASGGQSGAAGSGSIVVSPNPSVTGVAPPSTTTVPQVVNPFTLVAHDPLSTFAADVDTASYDQFVRDIGNGHLPDPSIVRTEEFVNYFTYDYPMPEPGAKDPFAITLAAAPSLFADGTTTLRVGIQGKPAPVDKKPVNLVFLVDVSGSMQVQEKLPLVQLVVKHALDVLSPTDTVSVVTYASGTRIALPPTPAGHKSDIDAVVNGLTAGGSTNGAGGIQLAYEQAQAGFIEGGISHVLLCTDGDFNVGITGKDALVGFITEKKKSGVTLTALGFGASVNDPMMEAVSDAGNGTYSVITSPTQASRYVGKDLLAALTYIAQDVKIQVEFNPSQAYAYRLLGYEDRAIPDAQFRNDVVDAGEISAGHRVTALYQVVPSGGTIPAVTGAVSVADGAPYAGAREVSADDLVLVKVRYKDVGAAETDAAHEVSMALPASAVLGKLEGSDADLRFAVAVGAFSELLRGSPYANPSALGTISGLVETSAGTDADRAQFAALFKTALPMMAH